MHEKGRYSHKHVTYHYSDPDLSGADHFPLATTIAAALVNIEPGAMREIHWHPHDEWQYYISGRGRMTVFASGERARTFDYQENSGKYS